MYLNRDHVEIPDIHKSPLFGILNAISSIGMLLAIWSIVSFSVWCAILGIAMAYLGKSWYLDRMVWLYETMKHKNEEYQKWDY